MDRNVTASIAAPCERVGEIIGDLATYPKWLELVSDTTAEPTELGDNPAWLVTIQAKIGPFSRSKRLRMVRTSFDNAAVGSQARFERDELDGRQHSTWTMQITLTPSPASTPSPGLHDPSEAGEPNEGECEIAIDLAYGGALWSGALEAVLGPVVESAGRKLSIYANNQS